MKWFMKLDWLYINPPFELPFPKGNKTQQNNSKNTTKTQQKHSQKHSQNPEYQ
jgi:hypothetical protein